MKALLCLFSEGELKQRPRGHNHLPYLEHSLLEQVLGEKGYTDIEFISAQNNKFSDYSQYNLIIGHGPAYERSFHYASSSKKIYYLKTNINDGLDSQLAQSRGRFINSYGALLAPFEDSGGSQPILSQRFSDGTLQISAQVCASTGNEKYAKPIIKLPLPIQLDSTSIIERLLSQREPEQAKANFLWFAENGSWQRGLDMCVSAFAQAPELNLHICGLDNQPEILEFFDYFSGYANIFYHGLVESYSLKFYQLLTQCQFSLISANLAAVPSSSINLLQYGLIPLIGKGNQRAKAGDFPAICRVAANWRSILRNCLALQSLSDEQLAQKSRHCRDFAHQYYNEQLFKHRLATGLDQILCD